MSKTVFRSILAGIVGVALSACSPSPAEVAQQLADAVNAKNTDGAMAVIAPEAVSELRPYVEDLIGKNTKLELVGQFTVDGLRASAPEKVTNDDYTKLGVAPADATLTATAIKGKLTDLKLTLAPEAQSKLTEAMAQAAKKVVDDFEAALNAKNIDGALALLSDQATVTGLDGKPLGSKDDMKAYFTQAAAQNLKLDKAVRTVNGSKLTWSSKVTSDDWTKAKLPPLDVDGQAIVDNGKISSFTLTLSADAMAKLEQAAAAAAAAAAAPTAKATKKGK